ncbi:hypothetical protein [Leifsonia sp. Leaf336]|uniref:hypothetical protein n=1 Tax=Leifsonia sp. Leaf336 TaxID=1736341 RepID=UPI0012F844BB|nr:hypothetical protein [Leifsonia sp. Leaf336]
MTLEQRGPEWVKSASPDQITAALQAGELAHYMGGKTPDELAHDAHVEDSPNRLLSEAYGFASHRQMSAVAGAYGSTLLESRRRDMTAEQLEKLTWLETASPEQAYAAEAAGELNSLLGRDVTNEAERISTVAANVEARIRAALSGDS